MTDPREREHLARALRPTRPRPAPLLRDAIKVSAVSCVVACAAAYVVGLALIWLFG